MEATEKLIEAIRKYSAPVRMGTESVGPDGRKYRYDITEAKYQNAPTWLKKLFEAAAAENGSRVKTQFHYKGKYSFHFARSPYKGSPDGKIGFSELILL